MRAVSLTPQEKSYYRLRFFCLGTEYYAGARFLFFARGVHVAGTLSHHAIEMFLKGHLCHTVSLHDLAHPRKYGHSLSRLWEHLKATFPSATLATFDSIISSLDKFEDLRYPDDGSYMLQFTVGYGPFPTQPYVTREYAFALADLDVLVQRLFAIGRESPVFYARRLSDEGRAALARENATGIWTT